jgi:hypothetical protein
MKWTDFGILISGITFSSCGKVTTMTSSLDSFYGELEITLVQSDNRKFLEKSIGSLQQVFENEGERFAVPYCTGVRISQNYLLTANHCVKQSSIFNTSYFASLPLDGRLQVETYNNVVRLFYDGTLDQDSQKIEKKAPYLAPPVFRDEKLDFAIIPLAHESTPASGWIDLTKAEAPQGQAGFLWGYPHGIPLAKAKCHLLATIDEGWLGHDCDAGSGASGGLIGFDDIPLAIHLSGPALNDGAYYREYLQFESAEIFAKKRGCPPAEEDVASNCLKTKGYNRALLLTKVAEVLALQAPLLWKELQGGP